MEPAPRRASRKQAWTAAQDAAIISMRNAGMTWPSIAREVGRSPYAIRRRWVSITRPGWTDAGPEPRADPPARPLRAISEPEFIQKCIDGGGFLPFFMGQRRLQGDAR